MRSIPSRPMQEFHNLHCLLLPSAPNSTSRRSRRGLYASLPSDSEGGCNESSQMGLRRGEGEIRCTHERDKHFYHIYPHDRQTRSYLFACCCSNEVDGSSTIRTTAMTRRRAREEERRRARARDDDVLGRSGEEEREEEHSRPACGATAW